jgi:hypothetical protein
MCYKYNANRTKKVMIYCAGLSTTGINPCFIMISAACFGSGGTPGIIIAFKSLKYCGPIEAGVNTQSTRASLSLRLSW